MLDVNELPFFTAGDKQVILDVKSRNIAFGICYETLQREHFVNAKQNGAAVYIASVAKPATAVAMAYRHFPELANEFKTPILMSKSLGKCDNFMSMVKVRCGTKKEN